MITRFQGSGIHETEDGQYTFHYVNVRPHIVEALAARGVRGGGHTWAALTRVAMDRDGWVDESIELDPEGDAISAYADRPESLAKLETILERLAADAPYRDECITLAQKVGYL